MKDEKEKTFKLRISKNQIVGRMLFNPLFKDPKLFVYDVENQELSGPMDIYYADKDYNGYYISAVKFEKDFYKLVKPSRYEDTMIFAADVDSTSNKNITFEVDKNILTVVESNKLRSSVIKTIVELDKYSEMKYILVFVSDCLFASPMIGVESYRHLKDIANDLHEWLAYGNITDKFGDAFKSFIGDQGIDVIQSHQSIANLFNTSMNENIFINEYGDVISYANKDIGIKMITEVLEDSGLICTKIFIDNVLIYQAETDGYTRISVNEEFLQNQIERGIYRKDPETDEYYVEDKSGKKVLVISITKESIQFQYPGKKFMATITSDHMQVVSESISVYMDANSYNDPFTYIDNGTIYYSDYSEDYMYIRDVFGVPCLNA